MQPPLDDTHPEIQERQVALIRNAGLVERAQRMRSLSRTAVYLSRRAILRAHPDYSQQEANLLFVRLHYGDDVADRLRNHLHWSTL
jgi:hypothetical protein